MVDTTKATLFWRTCTGKVNCQEVEVPASLVGDWRALVDHATRAVGLNLASRKDKGVFEIQLDAGIWCAEGERALRPTTARFLTWEELDSLPE